MNRSENINELVAALAKAQAAMSAVGKGNTVRIKSDKGEYSYKYADLGAIMDMLRAPLSANGLAIVQAPDVTSAGVDVETFLAHTSGQWLSCVVVMAVASRDPKAIGCAITYGRRYGLALVGAVTDEDDDADEAEKKPAQGKAQTKPAPAAPPQAPSNGTHPAPVVAQVNVPQRENKAAAIRTPKFGAAAKAMHDKLLSAGIGKYLLKDGGINFDHMARSAYAEGFDEITEANMAQVLAAIERRATGGAA